MNEDAVSAKWVRISAAFGDILSDNTDAQSTREMRPSGWGPHDASNPERTNSRQ
ncbi:hypothetical protein Tcan_16492 [Toxocara canis]|uniref:Uncharacterized protein n=1 Tax=Toxocara canis TaxID=6265 RepID=A0A0B2W5H4_TOXCA|nr:hypothetical protein Tcan_16492 [Toxocara canis]